MDTTLTAVRLSGSGRGLSLGIDAHSAFATIVVANVGERQYTEGHTNLWEQAERTDNILEVGIVGIELASTLLEIGDLSRQACVENHRQRIHCRI